MGKVKKLLIANRGEIAARIQLTCKRLNIPCATTVSQADLGALFSRQAQEKCVLSGVSSKDTYLNIEKIIAGAIELGCNAVHPGYGFLSENSGFAEAVKDAGLIFIGPNANAIATMGDKQAARSKVIEFGVPCLPGSERGASAKEILSESKKIGFPIIVKAVAGGGGRGMRIARSTKELESALELAAKEAERNFGSAELYIERYLEAPRHVEVQVLGDQHGNVFHFGTRDCTVQRRHQKLVEEAPAPFLSKKLREEIHKAAVQAAKSVNYFGAGTVEFLVDGEEFFFLEMNTRIQVEHPVTEEAYGVDLIEQQIRVANGEKLEFEQKDIEPSKYSIEYRIFAEDPERDFIPVTGKIAKLLLPESGCAARFDFGFGTGDEITPHYDGMIGKIIFSGRDRETVLNNSFAMLRNIKISPIKTSLAFHLWLLLQADFHQGPIDINFISKRFDAKAKASLSLLDFTDPVHSSLLHGTNRIDTYSLGVSSKGEQIDLRVEHSAGGVFVGKPVSLKTGILPQENWLSSSCLRTLIDEARERFIGPMTMGRVV